MTKKSYLNNFQTLKITRLQQTNKIILLLKKLIFQILTLLNAICNLQNQQYQN